LLFRLGLKTIPPKKFKNAIKSYAAEADGETALLQYDNTGFGSAKEGFVLTNKAFYCKAFLEKNAKHSLHEILKVSYEIEKNDLLLIIKERVMQTKTKLLFAVNSKNKNDETLTLAGETLARIFSRLLGLS
jgi:hypothetical protein